MTETRAKIFTGFALANVILQQVHAQVQDLKQTLIRAPSCAILLDQTDAGAQAYASRLVESAQRSGIMLQLHPYKADAESISLQLQSLRSAPNIDAVMPLFPIPGVVDRRDVAERIGPLKDADGQHPFNLGLTALSVDVRLPATAKACLLVMKHLAGSLVGKSVTLIGASPIVGRPLAQLLLTEEATVTVCHKATVDLAKYTRDADIIVSATGVAGLIKAEHVGAGSILIDVGIVRTKDGLVGDIDQASVMEKAAILTHVPDGIGPVTTACLLKNIVDAAVINQSYQDEGILRLH